jgi:predicted metal-dependent phosphotriesterase family hydrolase
MAASSSTDTPRRVRTLAGDVPAGELGMVLSHEHIFAAFGAAGGDPDLEFTRPDLVEGELEDLRALGVDALVEASTWDMGAGIEQIAAAGERAGLAVVKTTGWFRSPSADGAIEGRSAAALEQQLSRDLLSGFEGGAGMRAGSLGETGLTGRRPTRVEAIVLDATAAAAVRTGAAILVHTDDWGNAAAALAELGRRGVAHDRVVLCHLRCADPIDELVDLARAGVTLSFDQLGHSKRDPVGAVAERLAELEAAGAGDRIAISTDVGRLSRLVANGGSGYASPVRELLTTLSETSRRSIAGGAIAAALATPWEDTAA